MNAEAELQCLRAAHRALEEDKARLQAEHARVLVLKEGLEAQLEEALQELAELKRQLFGEKSEKLTPEEERELAAVLADLQEEAQGESPASDGVLEEEAGGKSGHEEAPGRPSSVARASGTSDCDPRAEGTEAVPELWEASNPHWRGGQRGI